jgi:predicted aspartyl protease
VKNLPGHLTRRAVVDFGARAIVGCSTLSWAGRALASKAPFSRNEDGIPSVPALSDLQQHLAVEVFIDSQGPFRFVVDTGADRTVLARDLAESLGLIAGPRVMVEGIVRTIPANTARVRNLSFGPVSRETLELPTLPRGLLGADGFLGLDAIDGRSVTFDFARSVLKIETDDLHSLMNWQSFGSTANKTRVQAQGASGHLKSFDCKVDGVGAAAFIDSGAQITIGNSALAEALRANGMTNRDLGTIPITGVTGGLLEGRVMSIRKVHVGGLSFSAPILAIADLQVFDLWGLGQTPALLIGMNYLRTFSRVTVDYRREEFLFELAGISETLRA